jgi:hypothetical protein
MTSKGPVRATPIDMGYDNMGGGYGSGMKSSSVGGGAHHSNYGKYDNNNFSNNDMNSK